MRVIETTLDEDLAPFSGWLRQQHVPHRVYEERGNQVLELADAAHAGPVRDAYQAWKSGRLRIEARPLQRPRTAAWRNAVLRYPGLSALVALAVLVFPFSRSLAGGELSMVAAWLTIVDPAMLRGAPPPLPEVLAQGQIWRWFTPALLHFSVLHLGFNCAVVIELGRRVESALGGVGLWLVVMALAGVSNLAQYAFGGGPLFGGLSGVAYGLLGYVVTRARLAPEVAVWQMPPGVAIGLLVFLVVFTTGITEPFGLYVANAAHWSGLGVGVALAFVSGRRGR